MYGERNAMPQIATGERQLSDLGLCADSVRGVDYRNCNPFLADVFRLMVAGLYLKGLSWKDIRVEDVSQGRITFTANGNRISVNVTKT